MAFPGVVVSGLTAQATVLSARQVDQFHRLGFLVLRSAIPQSLVSSLRSAIAAAADANAMIRGQAQSRNGSVPIYHHQSQWDARQSPRIYGAFAELLGQHDLWVSIEKARFQRAINGMIELETPSFIHWDIDLRRLPKVLMLQGVLTLSDSTADHGGFQCIPGFHREVPAIAANRLLDQRAVATQFAPSDVHVVSARAGDLIIWDSLLPHGSGRNLSSVPRIAQYIRMFEAQEHMTQLVQARSKMWCLRLANPNDDMPAVGDENSTIPARLSALGRRLAGVDSWYLPLKH